MGKYDFSARTVHRHATRVLQAKKTSAPPPWFKAIGSIPPAEILVRKPMQKRAPRTKKSSKLYKPESISVPEDKLRWEFFNDHPWELARPRVMLENDGKDYTRWDWSHPLSRPIAAIEDDAGQKQIELWDKRQKSQAARPINGEAVVQRQQWLMHYQQLSESEAYDKARKEFYRARHKDEVETRVAREEARMYGGVFGMSALEVGMMLEDRAFEGFKEHAKTAVAEARQNRQLRASESSFLEAGGAASSTDALEEAIA